MRRYITYKLALFSAFLISGGLYIYSPKMDISPPDTLPLIRQEFTDTKTVSSEEPSEIDFSKSQNPEVTLPDPTYPNRTVHNSSKSIPTSPILNDITLNARNTNVSLGDDVETVIKKLGKPGRVAETEYDFVYYIFNNDYKKLVFIAVKNSRVVGFYTDSIDFNYQGITSGADLNVVNQNLNKNYSMNEVLTHTADTYTLQIFMDSAGSKEVVGVSVLSKKVKEDGFKKPVGKAIELLVFDLTNSIRARNKLPVLSWSSSAAIAARKHSKDMAVNSYFDHLNPFAQNPGDRMREEGISFHTVGENIIAGYGTAIRSNHAWFNSPDHRSNILNPNFRYLGVGFYFDKSSQYETYLTQNFYR